MSNKHYGLFIGDFSWQSNTHLSETEDEKEDTRKINVTPSVYRNTRVSDQSTDRSIFGRMAMKLTVYPLNGLL